MLVLFFYFALLASGSYCPNARLGPTTDCSSVDVSLGCENFYMFQYDQTTAKVLIPPTLCIDSGRSSTCSVSIFSCEPSCLLRKTGGPNKHVCSDFFFLEDCANYYADNGGDKWCEYVPGGCAEALTCHN